MGGSIDKHSQAVVVDNVLPDGAECWCAEQGIPWSGMPENLDFGSGCKQASRTSKHHGSSF
jgi:hypothetical protein